MKIKLLKQHFGFEVGEIYEAVRFDNGWFVKNQSVSMFIPIEDAIQI